MTSENAVGNPTELAIARLAKEKFSAVPDELKNYRKIYEIPFDSTRKLMTVVYQTESGWLSVTKGAIDRIRIIPTTDCRKHPFRTRQLCFTGSARDRRRL